MKQVSLIIFLIFLIRFSGQSQQYGCTDSSAINYDSLALVNDGSCQYRKEFFSPAVRVDLPEALTELSGLAFWNGLFWGHNDGGNGPWLYGFDTTAGIIKKVIGLNGATNVDWEDMAQTNTDFFLGDFGNNANGNREDYLIYKIPKSVLELNEDTIMLSPDEYSVIQFSYEDQIDFSPTGPNNTKFDCEAMFFHGGKLHLITKNWVGEYSVHYMLPAQEGIWKAERIDSFNTSGFMITGADIGNNDNILLTAYNRSGSCRLYLVNGFGDKMDFFKWGNKKAIDLPAANITGQLEAVCFLDENNVAIGNERFRYSVFDVQQNLWKFSIHRWVFNQ